MAKRSKIEITGRIVTAWAETPSGPGWANRLVWVIARQDDGTLKDFAIQPEDQTPTMHALFSVTQAAHEAMVGAVNAVVHKR